MFYQLRSNTVLNRRRRIVYRAAAVIDTSSHAESQICSAQSHRERAGSSLPKFSGCTWIWGDRHACTSLERPERNVIARQISDPQLSTLQSCVRLNLAQTVLGPMFHRLHSKRWSTPTDAHCSSPSCPDRDLVACQMSAHYLLHSLRYGSFHPSFAGTQCRPTFLSHRYIMGNP